MGNVPASIIPRTVEEQLRIAQLFSRSTIVPKEYQNNPGNCYIAIDMGATLGMAPSQAVQAICVINGKPALYGDAIPAVVYNSPVFDPKVGIKETYDAATGTASCTAKRKDAPEPVTRTFTIEQAKKARLWGKQGPWTDYPERMLQMRARAFCLRDAFPDVLRGLAIKEEQEDAVEPEAPKLSPADDALQGLGASPEQLEFIHKAWEELHISPALRIVQCRRFAGNPQAYVDTLIDNGATITPKAIQAPKPRRGRPKKGAAVELEKFRVEPEPAPTLEIDPHAVCEHGVLIDQPCADCKKLEAELDAEAAKLSGDDKGPHDLF